MKTQMKMNVSIHAEVGKHEDWGEDENTDKGMFDEYGDDQNKDDHAHDDGKEHENDEDGVLFRSSKGDTEDLHGGDEIEDECGQDDENEDEIVDTYQDGHLYAYEKEESKMSVKMKVNTKMTKLSMAMMNTISLKIKKLTMEMPRKD